jgi:hypothetical protein
LFLIVRVYIEYKVELKVTVYGCIRGK